MSKLKLNSPKTVAASEKGSKLKLRTVGAPVNPPPTKLGLKHGEEVLNKRIEILLENNSIVVIDMRSEFEVPVDPEKMESHALKLTARLAFFNYQTARALDKVRKQEDYLKRLEGETAIAYRWHIDNKTTYKSSEYKLVEHFVDRDEDLHRERSRLTTLRNMYSELQSLRDALEHHVRIVSRLVGKFSRADSHA
jgi:hypothetical protein